MLHEIPVTWTSAVEYGTFNRGAMVTTGPTKRCDYWECASRIQETRNFFYLLITGTVNYGGANVLAHYVYRVNKEVLLGQDLQELADNLDSYEIAEQYANVAPYNDVLIFNQDND